ncbi:MAG: autotransporter assembly complex protein TamA [Rubrivivax sp.]
MTITRGRSGPHGKARFLVVLPAAALLSVATAWAQTVEPSPAGQPNPPTSQPPAAADVATSGRWTLRIDAPAELRGLLERYLDLARLPTLSPGENLADAELDRLIQAAPAQALELLSTEGYFDAKVSVDKRVVGPSSPVSLLMKVTPGPRARIKDMRLLVEGELSRLESSADSSAVQLLGQARAGWALPMGRPFRNADWSDAKGALLARLRSAGYALATYSGTSARVDTERSEVSLVLVVDSGPLFRAGEPQIDGLALHTRDTVLNLAGLQPGSPVTEALMLDFQERLIKSGLFEQASVTLQTDERQAAAAVLQVRVKEAARHQLITGLGISSNTGPRLTVEHIDRRAFARALVARNKLEWGQQRQAWDGELSTHVGEDGYRWFTGLTIERLLTNADTVLAQRVRLGRALEQGRIERTQYAEWESTRRRTDLARSRVESLTVNHSWLWRSIDNPVLPTDGQTLSAQLAGGALRSTGTDRLPLDSPLVRAHARVTVYRPLPADWYLQSRVEWGQLWVREGVEASEHLGFRAGGDDSVRGYAYRSLGPQRDGATASGKVVAGASVELARPLGPAWRALWGAVVIVAGPAADRWSDWRPSVGTGFGLRWRSPVGPLRVDLAYGEAVKRWRLHFSVGLVM